jgi:hypothetical protein
MRRDVGTRLVQVDVLVDMVDPRQRNKMMVLTIGRALLGELDFVGSIEVIDLPDRFPVRRYDVHVFFDFRRIWHLDLLKTVANETPRSPEGFAGLLSQRQCR